MKRLLLAAAAAVVLLAAAMPASLQAQDEEVTRGRSFGVLDYQPGTYYRQGYRWRYQPSRYRYYSGYVNGNTVTLYGPYGGRSYGGRYNTYRYPYGGSALTPRYPTYRPSYPLPQVYTPGTPYSHNRYYIYP